MLRSVAGWAALAALPALAGCATAVPPSLAVTQFAGTNCATTPDLAAAVSLTPAKDRQVWTVDQQINAASPCLDLEGSQGPYVLFALPDGQWGAPIEIGSVLEVTRLFSPHVTILDGSGAQTRSFTPEHYNVRAQGMGRTYSVQFLPQAGERYVLVTSNPLRMGTAYEGIATSTRVTTYWTGFAAANWTSGVESFIATGFSYEGLVRASVFRPEEDDD